MKNEIGDLQKRHPFGQFFDRVSTITQDPFLAVDIGNGTSARTGIGETRVIGDETEILVVHFDLPKVERPHGAVFDLNLVFPARPVVSDCETRCSHKSFRY